MVPVQWRLWAAWGLLVSAVDNYTLFLILPVGRTTNGWDFLRELLLTLAAPQQRPGNALFFGTIVAVNLAMILGMAALGVGWRWVALSTVVMAIAVTFVFLCTVLRDVRSITGCLVELVRWPAGAAWFGSLFALVGATFVWPRSRASSEDGP